MSSATIHNIPDEAHRDILETAVKPKGQIKLGSLLAEMGRKVRLTDEEFAVFESVRGKTSARATKF